uniref:Ubiquitin-like protein ATG12 n=1 Tax=Schistocephalus solidus TaxID=70667 RepID=A0A0V0JDG5_SCHSO
MPFNCQKQISTGCDLLQKFLYASVNQVLFRLNAYPSASFQSACLFGVPIKVCSNASVRDFILGFTDCLNLYNTGQQELIMRFESTHDSYLVTGNHLVFRFECYALREGQAFSSATWVEYLRQALIRLSLFDTQSFPQLKDSHWDLQTRNWFPSQDLSQVRFGRLCSL